jgi:GTP-binding protein
MVSCNYVDGVHFSYQRYLVNQFREAFDVVGTPVRLVFRTRGERAEGDDDE